MWKPKNHAPDSRSDPTYFLRHDRRNRRRVAAVIQNLTPGERVLDIGCNRGYFSRAVLDSGLATQVDAIEIEQATVDPSLLSREDFSLFEGDATQFDFTTDYRTILYCAVHHHVHRIHGNLEAFRLWRRIVEHCQRHIILETGQLLEGSRWDWQRALRAYYSSDEEYVGSLLHAIGPRLEGVKIIDTFSIHGTRRWLLRIDLYPKTAPSRDASVEACDVGSQYQRVESYYRTIGSRNQKLVEAAPRDQSNSKRPESNDRKLHKGTIFTLCNSSADDRKLWCKKSMDDPYKDQREYSIGSQVDCHPFVRPISLDPSWGVVYPYIDGQKLSDVNLGRIENRKRLVHDLLDIFDRAERVNIDVGDLDIDPARRGTTRKLIDLIDLHAGNILVSREGSCPEIMGIIDPEYFRNHNKSRNACHVSNIILRGRIVSCASICFLGKTLYWNLRHHLSWHFAPPSAQLYERYTSPLRYLLMRFREVLDSILRPLPGYWQ